MILDIIMKIILTVFLIVMMGTAIYTLIASEIRQRRIDKQYEDSMKRLIELREQEHEQAHQKEKAQTMD